jgi:hypothetical protein
VSRLTFPLFETERGTRPSSIPATVVERSMPCFTQMGMATVCGCAGITTKSGGPPLTLSEPSVE